MRFVPPSRLRGRFDPTALISLAGGAVLLLLLGILLGKHRIFPYPLVDHAEMALRALADASLHRSNRVQTGLWEKAWTDERGVTRYDPDRAFGDYTLYTSGHAQKAFLIDMQGKVIHEWHMPFSEVDREGLRSDARPDFTFYRDAHLYPNGDLLIIYVAEGITPWGLGMAKIDRDSNLLWSFIEPVHHDMSVGDDGRIYTLTHRIVNELPAAFDRVVPPVIDDYVVVLSPDGRKLRELSLLHALGRSDLPGFVETLQHKRRFAKGDILHTNTVEVLPPSLAEHFPFARAGNVLVSFRQLGIIAIVDLEAGKMTWAVRGPWKRQHDPDFLPNGHMLLFDNEGWLGSGGRSRVIEFEPLSRAILWQYTGTRQRPMFSEGRSRQQRLPNGDTLITVSAQGRLVEVTPEGRIAWEFVNPIRESYEGTEYIPVVGAGYRYKAEELPFLAAGHPSTHEGSIE